jgi:hypothetical protein
MLLHGLTLIFSVLMGLTLPSDCGDGITYASKAQTENDERFADFPKIDATPKFKGGDKKLMRLIKNRLELSEVAKKEIFNLNFALTVNCDGTLRDIKSLGDPKAHDFTNIVDVLYETAGMWTPAAHNAIPVNCVYVGSFFVYGDEYDY